MRPVGTKSGYSAVFYTPLEVKCFPNRTDTDCPSRLRCDRNRPCQSCVRRNHADDCVYMESPLPSEAIQRRNSSFQSPSIEESIARTLNRLHSSICRLAGESTPLNEDIVPRGAIPVPMVTYLTQKLLAIETVLNRHISESDSVEDSRMQEGSDFEETYSDESDNDPDSRRGSPAMEEPAESPTRLHGEPPSALSGMQFHTMTGAMDRPGDVYGIPSGLSQGLAPGLESVLTGEMDGMHLTEHHDFHTETTDFGFSVVRASRQIIVVFTDLYQDGPQWPANVNQMSQHYGGYGPQSPAAAVSQQHQNISQIPTAAQQQRHHYRTLLPATAQGVPQQQPMQPSYHQPAQRQYPPPQPQPHSMTGGAQGVRPQGQFTDLRMGQTSPQPRKSEQDDSFDGQGYPRKAPRIKK